MLFALTAVVSLELRTPYLNSLLTFSRFRQSLVMFGLRTVAFRLEQSPKWLTSAGRTDEAVVALRKISHINGDPVAWTVRDVVDQSTAPVSPRPGSPRQMSPPRTSVGEYQGLRGAPSATMAEDGWGIATQLGPPQLARVDVSPPRSPTSPASPGILDTGFGIEAAGLARTEGRRQRIEQGARPSWVDRLPAKAGESVDGYMARLDELFTQQWARTTTLVWAVWFCTSFAYTIFNVFLPSFLEQKVGAQPGPGRLEESLKDCKSSFPNEHEVMC